MTLEKADIEYLIARLERIKELVDAKENHMAAVKILADISALKARLND